jgi:DNA-binding transcriptional regulator YhcF (GntR family)
LDWNVLKAEYIAGGTSYRKLAEKYGIDRNAVQRVAKREKWCELKSQAIAKAETKMVNAIANDIGKNAVKINDVADKLLDKIVDLLEALEVADSQTIKQCTSALKDIKDIKGVKSDIDIKEQEARIEKLRKDADLGKTDDGKPSGVIMMPPIMDALTPPSEEDDNDG